jgi:Ca2+-binding RTX toxin-like protein
MMKRLTILLVVMGLMLTVAAGVAFAAVRIGTNGPDRLVGTAQNDLLRGRGGNDLLVGRGDSDRLFGGPGNDRINARERGRAEGDLVDCGRGRDVVLTDNTTEDRILANCEVVRRG